MKKPLSVYIHWPFCKSKCPYCDFNSHVRDKVEQGRWHAALLKQCADYAQTLGNREVASIFFGGGTPSLMEPQLVADLIEAVDRYWGLAPDAEITLEANPTSIEAEKFRTFQKAGINRVSVGIQSLVPEDLKFLGREHNVEEAKNALAIARDTFQRYSFDLIYARPKQSMSAWEAELKQALTFADGHLSLYQLTIEENTAFYTAHRKGAFVMPEDNLAADMYQLTQNIMEGEGRPAYEVSNHARAGQESRHNLAYWKTDDVIGIGPGAHGRYSLNIGSEQLFTKGNASPSALSAFTPVGSSYSTPPRNHASQVRIATEAIKSPERWLDQIERGDSGLVAEVELTEREQLEEAVMMGLRLRGGIVFDDWRMRTGLDVKTVLNPETVSRLAKQGFIETDDAHIQVTGQGRLLLNRITGELLS